MENKVKEKLDSHKVKALEYIKDKEKGDKLINDAIKKSKNNKSGFKEFKDDLNTLVRMFKSWKSGNYKNIPTKTIITIVAALLYFVNPFDVVPDFILYAGFIDDAMVLSFVIKSLKSEIDDFKRWEEISHKLK